MGISIALNLLPLIKNLSKQEQHLEKFFIAYTKLAKFAKNPEVEKESQKAAEVLSYRIISRTRRHTNRAAGSRAMSWNTKADNGDL